VSFSSWHRAGLGSPFGGWQLWGSLSRPELGPGTSQSPFDAWKLPQHLPLSQTCPLCRKEEIWVARAVGENGLQRRPQESRGVSLKYVSAAEFLLSS